MAFQLSKRTHFKERISSYLRGLEKEAVTTHSITEQITQEDSV